MSTVEYRFSSGVIRGARVVRGWVHIGLGGTFGCRDRDGILRDGMYATPPADIPSPQSTPAPPPPGPVLATDAYALAAVPARARPPRPYPIAVGTYPPDLIEGIRLHRDGGTG